MLGVSHPEALILAYLAEHGTVKMVELHQQLRFRKMKVIAAVLHLAERGMVMRNFNVSGRGSRVQLTELGQLKGKGVLEEFEHAAESAESG